MIRFFWNEQPNINNGNMPDDYLVLDEYFWENARKYFREHRAPIDEVLTLPVYDTNHNFICYAWNDDREANKEIRMLRELGELEDAVDFRALHPDCNGVTIHGFNELSWKFANYLNNINFTINVEGELWKYFGVWDNTEITYGYNYEVYAEGTWHKSLDLLQERIRTVSVEFECVDEIYEANIKGGKITDTIGDVNDLLERLRNEKEIVICDTLQDKALEVYDWLMSNNIDICAFMNVNEERRKLGRKQLFKKPILSPLEVANRFKNAIIIDCTSKYSSWGFGDVDKYDYEGYRRNERYICVRDYIDIPKSNLVHIVQENNIALTGDIDMCNILARWYRQNGAKIDNIVYMNFESEKEEIIDTEIPVISHNKIDCNTVSLLVLPKFASKVHLTKYAANRYGFYSERLKEFDYTDYFSYQEQFLNLENTFSKYTIKDLRPKGILLGAIIDHSGNLLVRQSLEGHPQIMEIDEYGYFNDNLYYLCIRLAQKESKYILKSFWEMYENEQGQFTVEKTFPNRKTFDQKFNEMLRLGNRFTSQELFVILHVAYDAMFGRNIDVKNAIIYWEPHNCSREIVRNCSLWLKSEQINGVSIRMIRNQYIYAGSKMKDYDRIAGRAWFSRFKDMLQAPCIKKNKKYNNWIEYTIRFEDLKTKPKETLTEICKWMNIQFDDSLMETTQHGKIYKSSRSATGFDVKPAYNLYEEYFSEFDRMRICMCASSFQKQNGYPYLNIMDFSRHELQDIFLKKFRWENTNEKTNEKTYISVYEAQTLCRYFLWRERFSQIMEKNLEYYE